MKLLEFRIFGDDIYLIASKNGKYGVQKNKKVIIDYSYQGIDYNKENNIFEIQRNSKFGIFNIDGKEIIPIDYNEISAKGKYIQAIKDENILYFDMQGNEVKDINYTSMVNVNEHYNIVVNSEGLYGVVDNNNHIFIENEYKYLEYLFGEYFIASRSEEKLGIINIENDVIVDFKYDVLQKVGNTNIIEGKILKENLSDLYSEKLAPINSSNDVAVYEENNYIIVYSKNNTKYYDLKGNELTAKQVFPENKLFAVEKEGKWGYENVNGELIVECKYNRVTEFNEYGFAGIKQEDKWGIINEEGKVIVEPIYNIEENNRNPEFLGEYYKVYYGYGEVYYTNEVN